MATPVSDWLRHSQLLLCDRYLEFNETWKEARSKRPLPRLCFSGRLEKQDGHPGLWLAEAFSASPLKPMNEIQQNSQEARSQRLLSRLCFSGLSEEQDSRPGLWLAEAFSISPLKPQNGIQQNLTGRKISTPSNKFVFFGSIGGKRWPPSLWFAETFRLLIRDRWTRFNETWQEARSQRPLRICVSRADKKGRPGLWLAGTFSTSPLWPLNRIQRNLTGSKMSTSSTKFVLFDRRNLTGSNY